MEFNEKLQELRKQKGLTQEELAAKLFVSRTAISKWESGRGYPNIDSLKAISKFFSISLDELLSSDEILTIAQKEQKNTESRFRDLAFGLLDVCMSLLFFLPLFAIKTDGAVESASLLSLGGIEAYIKVAFFAVVICSSAVGILTLALQSCQALIWQNTKSEISLILGIISVLLFTVCLQPYAAVFAFALLVIKVILLIKRQ